MTVFVAQKTVLDAYIQECMELAIQINQTTLLVAQKEAEFVSDGFKKPNLKSLIAAIKKLNVPIEQVFFKNVSGAVSISATQVDSVLDANIRQKLSVLVTKDITTGAIEPIKTGLLKTKVAISKNYGIPVPVMKNMIEVYKKESESFVKDGSLLLSISDGYKLNQL